MTGLKRCVESLKRQWRWLKWPAALGLLSYLFYAHREEFTRLADRPINWSYFAVAFALCGGAILLTFVRWYLLVWAQEFPFRVRDALRLGFIGYLFNYVAPGSAGGDVVKAVMIAREQESRRTVAAATVFLDRIVGLVALFVVGAIAAVLQPGLLKHPVIASIVAVLWGGSLAGTVGMGVLLHPAIPRSRWMTRLARLPLVGGPIGELVNGVLLYQAKRRVLVVAVGISVLGHFGMLSSFYFCAKALGFGVEAPGYWGHLLLIPGAELAGVVVPVPGGVGALEGAVSYCYDLANQAVGAPVDKQRALAAGFLVAVAFRVISILIAAVGAVYYFTARREIGRVLETTATPAAARTAVLAGDREV